MRLAYAVSRDWLYAVSQDWLYAVSPDKLFKYSVFIFYAIYETGLCCVSGLAYAVSQDWLYAVSPDKLFKYLAFIFMQYKRLARLTNQNLKFLEL